MTFGVVVSLLLHCNCWKDMLHDGRITHLGSQNDIHAEGNSDRRYV